MNSCLVSNQLSFALKHIIFDAQPLELWGNSVQAVVAQEDYFGSDYFGSDLR